MDVYTYQSWGVWAPPSRNPQKPRPLLMLTWVVLEVSTYSSQCSSGSTSGRIHRGNPVSCSDLCCAWGPRWIHSVTYSSLLCGCSSYRNVPPCPVFACYRSSHPVPIGCCVGVILWTCTKSPPPPPPLKLPNPLRSPLVLRSRN